MFLRAAAILSALAIPLLLTFDVISELLYALPLVGPYLGPALAALCALPVIIAGRERGQAIVGAALCALAAGLSPEVPELLEVSGPQALEVHDLREAPLPRAYEGQRSYLAARGFLREEWVIDEYPGGERPDQNERPKAVLLPLLGTEAAQVDLDPEAGVVVVARVAPERLDQPSPQTLRGRLGPISPELVEVLFVVTDEAGQAVIQRPPAVLLDTLDVPSRGEALTRAGLAAGAALLALLLLLTALPRREPELPATR
ncbi:hypothetical protein G6O69_15150 [Pseudenhygromyxa sp. WMMC2535]|uniref:hypothetical protein n=1 Tax=Pseudenhygromyxa sp. WMMC2535 TaxID=2712867 RepID=UPI0015579BC0|nr:hypothetical protein [Pseudenhygromyxa sp. WMMC2535]NVB39178.1 hypothetical protein [Pseudenhygromyxa sp. WMMC2535]